MASWGRIKRFVDNNIVLIVGIPGIVGLHWVWQQFQEDDRFVAEHERREFPPLTLYKIAKHYAGYGPMPEKHPPPGGGSRKES